MSLNNVSIMGNLTRDPEMKYTTSGRPVCNLSIANNRVFTRNGEKASEVSYFDVEVWGVVAENCSKYLSKGSGVIIEGRLKQDRWERDGKTQSRVRIVANNVHFMPRKGNQEGPMGAEPQAAAAASTPPPVANADSYETTAWDE